MKKLRIVKIGGQVIDQKQALQRFLQDFALLPDKKILVHGGGKKATALLERLAIRPRMVDGRRITDKETLEIVQMVYAGLINKDIIAALQSCKCRALGLSGADLDLIRAVKREAGTIDYGFVGDVCAIDSHMIGQLLNLGITAVFCSLSHDGDGQILNTNADTIATELAMALATFYDVELIFCFEKNGVLRDMQDACSVIPTLTMTAYQQLRKEKIISSGMIPKIDNAFRALNKGVKHIYITHFNQIAAFTGEKGFAGTKICFES